MPPSNQDAFDIFRSSKIGIKKSYWYINIKL